MCIRDRSLRRNAETASSSWRPLIFGVPACASVDYVFTTPPNPKAQDIKLHETSCAREGVFDGEVSRAACGNRHQRLGNSRRRLPPVRRAKLNDRDRRSWHQARCTEAEPAAHLTFEVSRAAHDELLHDAPRGNAVRLCHEQELRNMACNVQVDHRNDQLQQKHAQREEDEEEVQPFGCAAKPKGDAYRFTHEARLDEEHCHVNQYEAQLDASHQQGVFNPAEWLQGKMK
eukprot:7390753-Prymnesium_polylepis.1